MNESDCNPYRASHAFTHEPQAPALPVPQPIWRKLLKCGTLMLAAGALVFVAGFIALLGISDENAWFPFYLSIALLGIATGFMGLAVSAIGGIGETVEVITRQRIAGVSLAILVVLGLGIALLCGLVMCIGLFLPGLLK